MGLGVGLIQLPQVLERNATIVMGLRQIGLDDDGLRDEINGSVAFSCLMVYHTEQMQGDRLIGVDL